MSGKTLAPRDLNDPGVASDLASELAGDVLRECAPTLLQLTPAAAAAFFESYLARFYGGMTAVMGENAAMASLANVAECAAAKARKSPETMH